MYIDVLLIGRLTGKETTTKSYTSGTDKICIEIEGNGKPCKLHYSYNTLEGKPGAVIIGNDKFHQ
ncbi:fucose-binding lectin II [Photorhabdus temperata]|uniref:fucose-binding lectin II n=1 Tax=Photorhabdus temperata TaxID=574560 RepID=UPI000561088C|nr:fucose-binding lectin II [Photorhabdus temperata]MCT8346230.1 fucose-binding lectin II [Photorhabdus temperata]